MKWIHANGKAKLVWDGDKRPEISDGSVRKLKVFQGKYYYDCSFCNTKNVCPIKDLVCEDCLHSKKYQRTQKEETKRTVRTKSYKDAVAFGNDKRTGKPIAIDKRGNQFDPKETVYGKQGFDKDPQGWRATGKKVTDPNYGKQ